jgi:hypothetical protein
VSETKDVGAETSLDDAPRLRALCAEKPDRTMARVRLLWPLIQTALEGGHSLKRVCERLNEDGFAINYRTLSTCVSIVRRETRRPSVNARKHRARPSAIASTAPPTTALAALTSHESQRDPLANLRKYGTDRLPGFHSAEEPPDPEKLF